MEKEEEYQEVCPECSGDGFIIMDIELPNGKEVEKSYKCKNEWHDET